MGDFPLMTDTGTFVINGAERVIVSSASSVHQVYITPAPKTSTEITFMQIPLFPTEVLDWSMRQTVLKLSMSV